MWFVRSQLRDRKRLRDLEAVAEAAQAVLVNANCHAVGTPYRTPVDWVWLNKLDCALSDAGMPDARAAAHEIMERLHARDPEAYRAVIKAA